jgi:hypothetical protein
MRPQDVRKELRDIAEQWKELKQTKEAQAGEDLDALRHLSHDDLALLAQKALWLLEHIDEYHGYTISLIEHHCEPSAFPEGGWIVSQAEPGGGFNKLCKSLGHMGGYEVFPFWEDAQTYTEKMVLDAEVRKNFKTYPVILTIGGEPRTTRPWRYSKP